jgi:hypothetical protein
MICAFCHQVGLICEFCHEVGLIKEFCHKVDPFPICWISLVLRIYHQGRMMCNSCEIQCPTATCLRLQWTRTGVHGVHTVHRKEVHRRESRNLYNVQVQIFNCLPSVVRSRQGLLPVSHKNLVCQVYFFERTMLDSTSCVKIVWKMSETGPKMLSSME